MTNKELQKLGRRELLQLLLDQAKEAERLSKLLKENDEHLKQLEEGYERLRERLDKKDAQIHELKDALQAEQEKQAAGPVWQSGGGYMPGQQGMQGGHPGYGAPPEQGGTQLGGYQPHPPYPPQAPYGGQYPPQVPDPFPYQVPPQAQPTEQYLYQSPAPDPFPYQVPYQSAPAPEAQYQYLPPRPERKRQGGQQGKMPFRLKKDQENGKTTLFFGWQHN